jgi:subtilisin family serine protease
MDTASNPSEPPNGGAAPDKVDVQIELIRTALASKGVEVGVARQPDGDVDYLYQAGVILVRDAYLDRVREVLGRARSDEPDADDNRPENPGFIAGVALLSLAPYRYEVPAALDLIDAEVGIGVATPNHILSITPVYCCPATEPDEVPATSPPDPGVCDGGGSGVFIYITDTGLLAGAPEEHSWLAGVTGQPDHLSGGTIPGYAGHGTFVAGVARCMAPAATVLVTDDFTAGGALTEYEIVLRLGQALGLGPDIISLSAGATTRKDLPLLSFEAFWNRYRHYKNLVMVAAAGNNASRRPFWPAAFPEVVSVGAVGASGHARAWFSDYGPWVDVYAPGEDLVNAYATGTYTYREPPRTGQVAHFHGMARWSGTSFATPLVAGLIAARMSHTSEPPRLAARRLLGLARKRRVAGVGPVLWPCETGCEQVCRCDDRCGRAERACPCGCGGGR